MSKITTVEIPLNGRPMALETGRMAHQAGGSVTLRLGDTVLFAAATASREPRPGIDFFPLQIEYREKFYAAGRFPGGYFKREARPSEKEILTARVTDRPLRPLFPEGYRNDVQVINTLISCDGENQADILSINAASAALTISEIPFNGPIGAVRVGRINGELILNPTHKETLKSDLDLVYVGTRDLPMMIEGEAKEISNDDMLAAMKFAHPFVQELVDKQLELRRAMGLPDKEAVAIESDETLIARARELVGEEFSEILSIPGKLERQSKVTELKEKLHDLLVAEVTEGEEFDEEAYFQMFDALEIDVVRNNVINNNKRIDGRAMDELRPLDGEVGILPRTHGSSLFSRGETQAMATVTLGAKSDSQSMDAVSGGPIDKTFMLHYNFPPYCVGEAGRIGFTSRREIGHGNLAERSLKTMLPEDSTYTMRVVSEIMGSNGSSSMATVCAGCLALMDAGVKMVKPVAGISIGLVTSPEKNVLLTDILGAEDHCGDMDFKVSGTRDGITGFQVDLKIHGLEWDLVAGAFDAALKARIQILDFMATILEGPREELSPFAPRITKISIPVDKIGALIGPGGKNIRRITETTGAQIDIEDDGTVSIFSANRDSMEAAQREVEAVTAEAEVGKIYRGKVTGIKDFGAFVEIFPDTDGLVHISEMADFRVGSVEDICKVGDMMWVKCIGVDDRGKIRLSRKQAMAEMDEQEDAE